MKSTELTNMSKKLLKCYTQQIDVADWQTEI